MIASRKTGVPAALPAPRLRLVCAKPAQRKRKKKYRSDRARRAKALNLATREQMADLVRAILIDRIDKFFESADPRGYGEFLREQLGRGKALALHQHLLYILFPEAFEEPDQPPTRRGLVPRGGGERVGLDRISAYAELMGLGKGN